MAPLITSARSPSQNWSARIVTEIPVELSAEAEVGRAVASRVSSRAVDRDDRDADSVVQRARGTVDDENRHVAPAEARGGIVVGLGAGGEARVRLEVRVGRALSDGKGETRG